MLANNPMLGMLDFEKQSLDASKKMVTRMGYPMVGLGLNYSLVNKNECQYGRIIHEWKGYDNAYGILTLPVYRKKYNAMKNEAELLKDSHIRKLSGNSQFLTD